MRRPLVPLYALALAAAIVCAVDAAPALASSPSTPDACVYSGHSVRRLEEFGRLVGRTMRCALVYNDVAPDWASWARPWFAHHPDPDLNWAAWARAVPGRRLVVSQSLVPSSVRKQAWRRLGARGAYDRFYRRLAVELVASGLGDATIRLGAEANYDGSPAFIGRRPSQVRNWRLLWARAARAMRSVPGARFKFDWCVNAAYLPVDPATFYPGDDVVDIVGVDLYDAAVPPGHDRWAEIRDRPLGAAEVAAFARAHRKPLSIPEWGLVPTGDGRRGGGVDPAYIAGVGRTLAETPSSYQSYFFVREYAVLFERSQAAQAAYRSAFPGKPAAPRTRASISSLPG